MPNVIEVLLKVEMPKVEVVVLKVKVVAIVLEGFFSYALYLAVPYEGYPGQRLPWSMPADRKNALLTLIACISTTSDN